MPSNIVTLHPHAEKACKLRGASADEVIYSVRNGEQFQAKHNRLGFRCNFMYNATWQDRFYNNKQIIAFAVFEDNAWLVITVIVKYF